MKIQKSKASTAYKWNHCSELELRYVDFHVECRNIPIKIVENHYLRCVSLTDRPAIKNMVVPSDFYM